MRSRGINAILIGARVRLKKAIEWHELRIPKGTVGVITKIVGKGTGAFVKFDDGRKYGSFECWGREIELV